MIAYVKEDAQVYTRTIVICQVDNGVFKFFCPEVSHLPWAFNRMNEDRFLSFEKAEQHLLNAGYKSVNAHLCADLS